MGDRKENRESFESTDILLNKRIFIDHNINQKDPDNALHKDPDNALYNNLYKAPFWIYAILVLIPFLWGSTFILVKIITVDISIWLIQGLRHLIALIGMLPVLKHVIKASKELWKQGLITGLCNSMGMVFQTLGLLYTSAGKTGFLTTLYVVLTPLFSWLIFHKKINKRVWIAVFIDLTGLILLSIPEDGVIKAFFNGSLSSSLSFLGDMLVAFSSIFFALQIVLTEHFLPDMNSMDELWAFSFIQILIVTIVAFIGKFIFYPKEQLSLITSDIWWILIYLGLAASILPFVLQNISQKQVSGVIAALFFALEPIFGTLFAVWIGGESIGFFFILGGSCMLISSIVAILSNN